MTTLDNCNFRLLDLAIALYRSFGNFYDYYDIQKDQILKIALKESLKYESGRIYLYKFKFLSG